MWNLWNMKLNFLNAITGKNSIAQSPCLTSTYFIFRLCFCAFWTYNCILEKQICATLYLWSFYFNFFADWIEWKTFPIDFVARAVTTSEVEPWKPFTTAVSCFQFETFIVSLANFSLLIETIRNSDCHSSRWRSRDHIRHRLSKSCSDWHVTQKLVHSAWSVRWTFCIESFFLKS